MQNRFSLRRQSVTGFTLVEILVVIAIISLLSSLVITTMQDVRKEVYLNTAKKEFRDIHTGLQIYMKDHDDWPADVNRGIPPGVGQYLSEGDWPRGPWPHSWYDWENWGSDDLDHEPKEQIYQISIRFCPYDEKNEAEDCRFPDAEWAENFDYHSSVYYCIQGPCRAHSGKDTDHPGYCVNC